MEEIRYKNEFVDEYCEEIGKDPRTLRRSYWFMDLDAEKVKGLFHYYESEDAFREMVRPYIDMGVSEVLLSYPYSVEQLSIFEKIARKAIPELKKEYNK